MSLQSCSSRNRVALKERSEKTAGVCRLFLGPPCAAACAARGEKVDGRSGSLQAQRVSFFEGRAALSGAPRDVYRDTRMVHARQDSRKVKNCPRTWTDALGPPSPQGLHRALSAFPPVVLHSLTRLAHGEPPGQLTLAAVGPLPRSASSDALEPIGRSRSSQIVKALHCTHVRSIRPVLLLVCGCSRCVRRPVQLAPDPLSPAQLGRAPPAPRTRSPACAHPRAHPRCRPEPLIPPLPRPHDRPRRRPPRPRAGLSRRRRARPLALRVRVRPQPRRRYEVPVWVWAGRRGRGYAAVRGARGRG